MAPADVGVQLPQAIPSFQTPDYPDVPDLGPQNLINQHFENARLEAKKLSALRAQAAEAAARQAR